MRFPAQQKLSVLNIKNFVTLRCIMIRQNNAFAKFRVCRSAPIIFTNIHSLLSVHKKNFVPTFNINILLFYSNSKYNSASAF